MAARKKKQVAVDFDDEDSVLTDVAAAIDVDPDDLRIKESHLGDFGAGTVYEITIRGGGHKEWFVVANDDQERELALAMVKQDLEESPENFEPNFIESHIDLDRLRRDLESDVQSSNEERLWDMDPEEFWKQASQEGFDEKWIVTWKTSNDSGELRDTFASESDAIDAGEHWKESMAAAAAAANDEDFDEDDLDCHVEAAEPEDSDVEQLATSLTEAELKDPMQYLEDIYGREDAVKKAIEIAGIDVDAAAEEAVDTDGPSHFLSSYDGNSYTTAGGLVYWRQN
jgi:hypothetical protein